jgi:hypothetical protein
MEIEALKPKGELYRYDVVTYASMDSDEYSRKTFPNTKLELRTYQVLSETTKGVWIVLGDISWLHGTKKWVSSTSRKRFAHPTKLEALEAYIKRAERRVEILTAHITQCSTGISLAHKEIDKIKTNHGKTE